MLEDEEWKFRGDVQGLILLREGFARLGGASEERSVCRQREEEEGLRAKEV